MPLSTHIPIKIPPFHGCVWGVCAHNGISHSRVGKETPSVGKVHLNSESLLEFHVETT